MAHEFILLIDGELKTYTKYEDIPEDFDNVIKFAPDVPEEERQVDGCEGSTYLWNERLKELLEKENASGN
jgi:hypothetical protein|tara:strand:+ start:208 stop:417 length:210 start_codon:yes stop_codon:yes gene_type:complete